MTARGRHLRTEPTTRRLLRAVASVGQVVLVLAALAVIGLPMATDYQWRTVVTGSMRPAIEPGDVILAAPLTEAAQVGDVVVFADPSGDRDIVHRISGFDDDGMVITKGDANNGVDPWALAPEELTGSVVFKVPKVGFLVEAMDSKTGIVLFLVVPALAIIAVESRVWYRFIRYGKEAFDSPQGRHAAGGAAA